MRIGFTGTQAGMTKEQKRTLDKLLCAHAPCEFHHGDCIGADAEAHEIARQYSDIRIIIHPPNNPRKRAFCEGDKIRPEKPYLARNRDIVDETEILIGAPKGPEELRSGTWSTIRYDKKVNHPLSIIRPDGSETDE